MTIEKDMNYSIIINTIKVDKKNRSEDQLFAFLKQLQKKYPQPIIQLFSTQYLINTNHLFYAIYFSLKAYRERTLISNRPSIELLLYLSGNRQIREAIQAFGITNQELKMGVLNYCIAAKKAKIEKINSEFLDFFEYSENPFKLNTTSNDKFTRIKNYFNISDAQLATKLNSFGAEIEPNSRTEEDMETLCDALCDLIVEKMVLLSLEST